ncbi:MAG TPA: DUF1997 domain-containing protein [Allocoleopsis sp.]
MLTQFFATQTLEMTVEQQTIPIQHYLRQPQRLVQALTDHQRIEHISNDVWRLKMRPLKFMMFNIQPTVDLKVWHEGDGVVNLQSVGCEIRGIEYINQRFDLQLLGKLHVNHGESDTYLIGKADLKVCVELPPVLWFTPKGILETTGNGLLYSVLLTIKQRLMHQLLSDYKHWALDDVIYQEKSAQGNLVSDFSALR